MTKKIAQIIPRHKMPRKIKAFDYLVDEAVARQLEIGQILEIPFGKRKLQGLFIGFSDKSEFKSLKEIKVEEKKRAKRGKREKEEKEKKEFLFDWQIEFLKWFAAYYYYSLPSSLSLMLPEKPKRVVSLLKKEIASGLKVRPLDKQAEKLAQQIVSSQEKKYLLFPYHLKLKEDFFVSLVKKAIKDNFQILIILPQVHQVEEFASLLNQNLKEKTAVITGELSLSKNQHYQVWQDIKDGNYNLILGTRSTIFAPLSNCQMIIVDDAHSNDLKQWDQNPRYSVVTCAQKLQELFNCQLILSSISPRIEDSFSAKEQNYKSISLPQIKTTEIKIIDLAHERQKGFTYLSDGLLEQLDKFAKKNSEISPSCASSYVETSEDREASEGRPLGLPAVTFMKAGRDDNNGRALLIVNKRGQYSYLLCHDCGYSPKCPHCEMPLTVDAHGQLICYHCSYQFPIFLKCPQCQSTNLQKLGIGIEQLEKELKSQYNVMLSTGQNISAKIWEKIDFLGFAYVDSLAYLSDFNSNFKLYSFVQNLVNQAQNQNPRVAILVQTCFPDNPAFESLNKDYRQFYQAEIEQRKSFGYPPFFTLIKLFFQHHDLAVCKKEAFALYENIKTQEHKNIKITEPYLHYVKKVRKKYRYQIAMFLPLDKLGTTLEMNLAEENKILSLVPDHWTIDKDPIDLL